MDLKYLFENSRLTVISGRAKSTKLTLCLFAVTEFLDKAAMTIISPANSDRILAKLKISQSNISNFSDIGQRLSFHFFKSNWNELKVSHGLELFEKDLEQLFAKTEDKYILFHLFHRYFDVPDRRFIEPFVEAITRLAVKHDKYIFFTCDNENENYPYIAQYLNGHADLLLTTKETNHATTKAVDIEYSVYPVEEFNYHFKLKAGELSFYPAIEKATTENDAIITKAVKDPVKTVLLLSNDENIIRLNQYLIGNKKQINLKVCRNLSEALGALLMQPTLIINHCDDIEDHYNLSTALEKNHASTALIFIINKNYVREEDRIKASELYNCNQIFDMNFRLLDYVLALEKDINLRFYARETVIDKCSTYFEDTIDFNGYLKTLRDKNLFYCVHQLSKVKLEPEIITSLLRGNDAFHIDSEGNGWLVCVNSQKEDAAAILQKITQVAIGTSVVASNNLLSNIPRMVEESLA